MDGLNARIEWIRLCRVEVATRSMRDCAGNVVEVFGVEFEVFLEAVRRTKRKRRSNVVEVVLKLLVNGADDSSIRAATIEGAGECADRIIGASRSDVAESARVECGDHHANENDCSERREDDAARATTETPAN